MMTPLLAASHPSLLSVLLLLRGSVHGSLVVLHPLVNELDALSTLGAAALLANNVCFLC